MRKIFTFFAAILCSVAMMATGYKVWGNWDGFETQSELVSTDGGLTASVTIALDQAKIYDFCMIINETYYPLAAGNFTRANNEQVCAAGSGNSKLEADVTGDYTFTWTVATNTLTITFPALPAPADIDVQAIVNNQEGTLIEEAERVQGTPVNFGVNASNERVSAEDESAIMIVAGKYHSEHGLTNAVFTVKVPGDVDIFVGECTYSSKVITVTNSASAVVATKTPTAACWKNDPKNVAVLHYEGEATTLTITGMDYCPFIRVKTAEEVITEDIDVQAIVNNQAGTLVAEAERVQGTTINFGVNASNARVAADAESAILVVSGKYHSEHGLTNAVFTVKVPGNVDIYVGQCTYSGSAIVVTNSSSETVATEAEPTQACWKNDPNNVTILHYEGGATTLSITGMQYCPFIRVKSVEGTPTAIEEIGQQPKANSQKLIVNGQLLIMRDGRTFNALGVEVK